MLDCNTYVVKGEKSLIIDVGLDRNFGNKANEMKQDGIDPASIDLILNTHLHLDHCCGNMDFKEKYGGTILVAPEQKAHYQVSVHEAAKFFGLEPIDFQEDGSLLGPVDLGGLTIAGGKMKSVSALWSSPNIDATNSSGFSGLPGGDRGYDGYFYNVGDIGYWWTSTEFFSNNAWLRYLGYGSPGVTRVDGLKVYGFSVRCLRDN